eukprot:COSAG02_NODE_468_length_21758_cov_41.206796_8_plen_583_part_00
MNNDKQMLLEAVKRDGLALRHASEPLRNDPHIVREAVKQDGLALRHASEPLRNDAQIVLEAVKQDGSALADASEPLRSDAQIVLEAVKQWGGALAYASKSLRNDPQIVLEAVKQWGGVLADASEPLRNDAQIVLEAVKQHGCALKRASEPLRNDAQIVLEAVKQNGLALEHASKLLQNNPQIVLEAVKQDGRALQHAAEPLQNDLRIVIEAVRKNGRALRHASEPLQNNPQIVLEAVKQNGRALAYASEPLRNDAQIVIEAVKQDGDALRHASAHLRQRFGSTSEQFVANIVAHQHNLAERASTAERPAKKRKLDPEVERRLASMMQVRENVAAPPLRTLGESAFLKCYDSLPAPRTGRQLWTNPLEAVADGLPTGFRRDTWEQVLRKIDQTQHASTVLGRAGAACVRLWSENAVFRLVQQVVLMDDVALLEPMMPFIKCLNAFILDKRGLLKHTTTAYRASRMSRAQADALRVGEKYRLGMYVATSTRKCATGSLKEWQEREMGGSTRYSWQFTIPKGCHQATEIHEVSAYGDEHEVLLVPYSAILVTGIRFDKGSGMTEVSADVLVDSYIEPLDLPTITA